MSKLNPDFNNLDVRLWMGDSWPEKRVSLACSDDGHAVMISPRYADIGQAQANAEEIAMRCRYHDRLVDSLRKLEHGYGYCDYISDEERVSDPDVAEARALLSELSAHNGGGG